MNWLNTQVYGGGLIFLTLSSTQPNPKEPNLTHPNLTSLGTQAER